MEALGPDLREVDFLRALRDYAQRDRRFGTVTLDEYLERFTDEPGYLDFARVGPVGRTAREEDAALQSLLGRAALRLAGRPLRSAGPALGCGGRADRVPRRSRCGTSPTHPRRSCTAVFGITGPIAMWAGEFPSLTFAAVQAGDALHVVQPRWLEPDHGRITPGLLREQLTDDVVAVAVSAGRLPHRLPRPISRASVP